MNNMLTTHIELLFSMRTPESLKKAETVINQIEENCLKYLIDSEYPEL